MLAFVPAFSLPPGVSGSTHGRLSDHGRRHVWLILAVLLLAVSTVSYILAERHITQQRSAIRERARPTAELLRDGQVATATGAYALRGFLLTRDTFFLERYRAAAHRDSIVLARAHLLARELSDSAAAAVARLIRLKAQWRQPVAELGAISTRAERLGQLQARDSLYRQVLRASGTAARAVDREVVTRLQTIRATESLQFTIALLLALLSLGVALVLARLGGRLRALTSALRRRAGEAERRAQEETALREAAAAVSSAYTVEETTQRIARNALEATQADGAFVERIRPDAEEVEIVAVAGAIAPPAGARVRFTDSWAELVVEQGQPVLIPTLAQADRAMPEFLARHCSDCSAAVIPLADDEAIGALILIRAAGKWLFRPDELARAHTFGHLAALTFRRLHLLEESERRRTDLEHMTESRARLMRGFSHDVKNPLSVADGNLQLLRQGILGPLSERQALSVDRVRQSIASALGLIDDMLELARAEAGQIQIDAAPIDIRAVVREVTEGFRAQAVASGLEFRVDLTIACPVIESDVARVRQILGNLLSNAIKYTAAGAIDIRALPRSKPASKGSWVVVEVSDTGPGVPRELSPVIFREFTRLDPDGTDGAGVGLAISRRLARALGGDITLESEVGSGSTFMLWLPAHQPARGR